MWLHLVFSSLLKIQLLGITVCRPLLRTLFVVSLRGVVGLRQFDCFFSREYEIGWRFSSYWNLWNLNLYRYLLLVVFQFVDRLTPAFLTLWSAESLFHVKLCQVTDILIRKALTAKITQRALVISPFELDWTEPFCFTWNMTIYLYVTEVSRGTLSIKLIVPIETNYSSLRV